MCDVRLLDYRPIALWPRTADTVAVTRNGAFVRITTLARRRSLYLRLKRSERHHLKSIVEGRLAGLSAPVCESLIDLGLARRDGDALTATEDGQYVASLY
jgi:hypothetical protein